MKDFGTYESPKSIRLGDSPCGPGHPAPVCTSHLRAGQPGARVPNSARRRFRRALPVSATCKRSALAATSRDLLRASLAGGARIFNNGPEPCPPYQLQTSRTGTDTERYAQVNPCFESEPIGSQCYYARTKQPSADGPSAGPRPAQRAAPRGGVRRTATRPRRHWEPGNHHFSSASFTDPLPFAVPQLPSRRR